MSQLELHSYLMAVQVVGLTLLTTQNPTNKLCEALLFLYSYLRNGFCYAGKETVTSTSKFSSHFKGAVK